MYEADTIAKILDAQLAGVSREKVQYFAGFYRLNVCQRQYIFNCDFYPLNPHVLLIMILDELENNNNQRNLEFFRERLKKAVGQDSVCKQKYAFLLRVLEEQLLTGTDYVVQLCRELLKKLDNGQYGMEICRRLEEVLFDASSLEKAKSEIRYLTVSFMIEQLVYGYHEKSVNKLIDLLFEGWEEIKGIIYTDYPFCPEFEEDRGEQIRTYMENLTIRDRITDLQKLFRKKARRYILICGISGIKGSVLDIEIGKIKIYNAQNIPKYKIENDEDGPVWMERLKKKEIHAAVEISCLDSNHFEETARDEIEKALDTICCYTKTRVPIHISMSDYVVLDEDLKLCKSSMSIEDDGEIKRQLQGLNYDWNDSELLMDLYQKYSGSILGKNNALSDTVQDTARWFRKGEDSRRREDKLLNYWIGLENLFPNNMELPAELYERKADRRTKFANIYAIVPELFVQKYILNYLLNCYNYCRHLYYDNRRSGKCFPISKELAQACQFEDMKNIRLDSFLLRLGDIIAVIPDGPDKDYCLEVQRYVSAKGEGAKLGRKIIAQWQESLIMNYRFRNIIVHNAKYSMGFIEYYTEQLRMIAGDVTRLIIEKYEVDPEQGIPEILLRRHIHNRELMEELMECVLLEHAMFDN